MARPVSVSSPATEGGPGGACVEAAAGPVGKGVVGGGGTPAAAAAASTAALLEFSSSASAAAAAFEFSTCSRLPATSNTSCSSPGRDEKRSTSFLVDVSTSRLMGFAEVGTLEAGSVLAEFSPRGAEDPCAS